MENNDLKNKAISAIMSLTDEQCSELLNILKERDKKDE